MKSQKFMIKIRSIQVPMYMNPGPSEMRSLWREAKSKSVSNPNHCKFLMDKSDNLYVWCGNRGLHRFVVKNLKMNLSDFQAFGVFETEKNDPRKIEKMIYISKNSFQMVTNVGLQQKFMNIIVKLNLKKSPTFKAK